MENRDKIIEGAAGLFRRYGIKSVTMDSIASHLGISKRTIYESFADKDELLIGVLCKMAEMQHEFVRRILNESNPIEAIFRILEMSRDHIQSMSPAFQEDMKKFCIAFKGKMPCDFPEYGSHKEIIGKGITDGLFRTDINADLANRCLYQLGRGIMDDELYPYDLFTRNEVIRNIFINYLRGISTVKGLELIDKLEANFIRMT